MLTLVTSNPLKYAPFADILERCRIVLEPPKGPLPELQAASFTETLAAKAQAASAMFGRPVLVDDAGLTLKAYEPFPGPLTSVVLRSLGVDGLKRLLTGVSDQAAMECHIGCWIDGSLRSWSGRLEGRLDLSRIPKNPRMILSDIFVPNEGIPGAELPHRARSLRALEGEALDLHLRLHTPLTGCDVQAGWQCPFCLEMDDPARSIFATMMQGRLESRIIYEDEDFVVMPVLGQFTEGGLLLLARAHIPSFAHLEPKLFPRLEQLFKVIGEALQAKWGVPPLFFEHGPSSQTSKGGCCVDHAHFNIFPARASIRPQLHSRMQLPLQSLSELQRLRNAEFGYLFVQENDATRNVFDGLNAPSQLVRRIITSQIGRPERWHWRDYPGCDELLATYHALNGRLRL